MIELTDIAISLDDYAQDAEHALRSAASKKLSVSLREVTEVRVLQKDVDIHDRNNVHFVMTLGVSLQSEKMEMNAIAADGLEVKKSKPNGHSSPSERYTSKDSLIASRLQLIKDSRFKLIKPEDPEVIYSLPAVFFRSNFQRPVVIGAGPAGLFATLYLAHSGLKPLLIEEGPSVDECLHGAQDFDESEKPDPLANVQFGECDANMLSAKEGATSTENLLMKSVLRWLVEAGAPKEILVDPRPHMGTDELQNVVKNIVRSIRVCGGEVRFDTKLVDFVFKNGVLAGLAFEDAKTQKREVISASQAILAPGYSSRDVLELVKQSGLLMERKAFSVGVRIEHPQSLINAAQYGSFAGHATLPAAGYELSAHLDTGRDVYTCGLCPGGYVVAAASQSDGVAICGKNSSDLSAENTNSAVMVSVQPEDLPGSGVLAGVDFQRQMERAAALLAQQNGGAPYTAPAQRVGDFLRTDETSAGQVPFAHAEVNPSYTPGVAWSDLHECLPEFVSASLEKALPLFDQKLNGFAHPDAVMTGVETQSSSPVCILRNHAFQAYFPGLEVSDSLTGVFPCGEGAGHADGFLDAALDGIEAAKALIRSVCIPDVELFLSNQVENNSLSVSASTSVDSGLPNEKASSERRGVEAPLASFTYSNDGSNGGEMAKQVALIPSDYYSPGGDFYQYQQTSSGEAILLQCIPASSVLEMPTTIDGLLVTGLSKGLFDDMGSLAELSLPAGLRSLACHCFSSLRHLKKLVLPSRLDSFDTRVLADLKSLESLQLPDMMIKIPSNIFSVCQPTELIVGQNARGVADGAFSQSTLKCIRVVADNPYMTSDGMALYDAEKNDLVVLAASVETYEIKPGCTRIKRKAFAVNTVVKRVIFPDSVKVIEQFAFFRSGITEFHAPKSLKSIGVKSFCQCADLKTIQLNEGLTYIGSEAFVRTPLRELALPSTLEHLGLSFCDPITHKTGQATLKISINPGPSLFVLEESRALYKWSDSAEGQKPELTLSMFLDQDATTFDLREDCVSIAPYACQEMKNLTYIALPRGVRTIGDFAFKGCSKLQSVESSECLEQVGSLAFLGTNVQSFSLPATFMECAEDSFTVKESPSGLSSTVISQFYVDKRNSSFYLKNNFLCRKLGPGAVLALYCFETSTKAVVPEEVTALGSCCFSGARAIDTIEIHDGIQTFAIGSLRCPHMVTCIVIRCLNAPLENHTQFVLPFPDSAAGRETLRFALESRNWSVANLFQYSDEVTYWSRDSFLRASVVVGRLADPVFLTEGNKTIFTQYCQSRFMEIADLFMKANFLLGFQFLAQLGFLNQDNVAAVVDMSNQYKATEITAYLLELRRTAYHYDIMAEYDL